MTSISELHVRHLPYVTPRRDGKLGDWLHTCRYGLAYPLTDVTHRSKYGSRTRDMLITSPTPSQLHFQATYGYGKPTNSRHIFHTHV